MTLVFRFNQLSQYYLLLLSNMIIIYKNVIRLLGDGINIKSLQKIKNHNLAAIIEVNVNSDMQHH